MLQDGKQITEPLEIPEHASPIPAWQDGGRVTARPFYMNHLVGIGLTGMKMRAVPNFFQYFHGLKSIGVVDNPLTEFPSAFQKLPGLLGIFVSRTGIPKIPAWVGKSNPKLMHLAADSNTLTQLPSELGLLTAIRSLRFAQNRIAAAGIPGELLNLKMLNHLDFGDNRLSSIPDFFVQSAPGSSLLATMPKLRCLNFEGNRMETLPSTWTRVLSTSVGSSANLVAEFNDTLQKGKKDALLVRLGGNAATANYSAGAMHKDAVTGIETLFSTRTPCVEGCDDMSWLSGRVFNRVGDGVCDIACNASTCRFDGGDCEGSDMLAMD